MLLVGLWIELVNVFEAFDVLFSVRFVSFSWAVYTGGVSESTLDADGVGGSTLDAGGVGSVVDVGWGAKVEWLVRSLFRV